MSNASDNAWNPAFPANQSYIDGHRDGLTKREYFAGLAMQALIASQQNLSESVDMNAKALRVSEQWYVGHLALSYADAMLDQLAKPQPVDPVRDAAPEILEALELFEEFLMRHKDYPEPIQMDDCPDVMKKVLTAIAKAKGEMK